MYEPVSPWSGCFTESALSEGKVEPKTFFANERTFLQWLNTAVLIGSIGIAIKSTKTSAFNEGSILIIAGMIVCGYALHIYVTRMRSIKLVRDSLLRKRSCRRDSVHAFHLPYISPFFCLLSQKAANGFADYYGPFWMTALLIVAFSVSAATRFSTVSPTLAPTVAPIL